MRKIFALVFSIFLFTNVKATRNVDLSVTILYPSHNTATSYEVESNKDIYLDVVIKNVGNASLQSSDVIFYGLTLDSKILTYRKKIVEQINGQNAVHYETDSTNFISGVALAPGDTFHVKQIFRFSYPQVLNGNHSFCFFAIPDSNTLYFIDGNRNNNLSCVNVVLNGGWATGINEVSGIGNTLDINPNPAKDEISTSITIADKNQVSLKIIDLSGRVIAANNFGELNPGQQNLKMSIAQIPQGFYIAQLLVGDRAYSGKFVVNH